MRIARYLLARLGGMLVVMAIVAVLVFVLTRAASGDPIAVLLGDQATADDIARVQKVYGLDKPLPVQFGSGCASCCTATSASRSSCSGR